MAIGGFLGSALAGLSGYDRAQQEAQQNQYRQIQQRMLMQEFQQRQQQEQFKQQVLGLVGRLGGMDGLSRLMGGAPPLQQMPQSPMPQQGGGQPDQVVPQRTQPGQDMGGGMAAGGALTGPANWEVQHNNFGGLRKPGVIAGPHAGGFQSFDTPEEGVSAISRQLDRYASGKTTGRPLNTIKDIVSTWAPASDKNPTDALIKRASAIMGVAPDQPINVGDPQTKAKLVEATIRNEQGGKLPVGPDVIQRALKANPEIAPHSEALGKEVAQNIPSWVHGQVGLPQLMQMINQAAPDASDAVKGAAMIQLHELLAPYEKMQFQQYMKENQQAIQLALKDMQIRAAELRQDKGIAAAGDKGTGQVIQRGDKFFQMTPNGPKEIQFPGEGAVSRVGSASQSGISPETSKFMADGIANYQLPPLSGWALKSPNGQSLMAEVMKINPKYDATEYTAKQSGARAVGTRSKTLEMATGVAEELIPLAQETSDKIDRTQFPTVNAMIIAADKGTGGEDVVRFLDQLNSLKYAYARALNPTGQARVEDLKRFDDILDTSWSKGQVRAALDQMRQSLAAERRGIEKTRNKSEGGAAPASPGAETPTVSSPEEYAKLPKGARYKGPDGTEYTKGQ